MSVPSAHETALAALLAKLEDPRAAATAYESLVPEYLKIALPQVRRITLNTPEMVARIFGRLPRLYTLRPLIVDELPRFDLTNLDGLEPAALGLLHARRLALGAGSDDQGYAQMIVRGEALRARLLDWSGTLVQWRIVSPERIAEIREGRGHADLADDLSVLGGIYVDDWPRIEGKVDLRRGEAEEAQRLGPLLLAAIGRRDRDEAAIAANLDLRRAYTLVVNRHIEVQRAVEYVRFHEGDASEYAPSLFNQGNRRRRSPTAGGTADETPGPATPTTPAAKA